MNIGILIIATNKYIRFINPLVQSINLYFLKNHNKKIFCFTNHKYYDVPSNVKLVYQEHMNWPFITLKRYEIFYKNKELYNDIDVLYYLDADMLVVDEVSDDFLPINEDLIAVEHPAYRLYNLQTFERRVESLAYVDYNHYVYHCGGVQGGKKDAYLKVCETLSKNIETDLNNGIIAIWHDESHWNSYLIKNNNTYKSFNASYCYPENWQLPLKKIILALNKNHDEIRN